MTSLSSTTTIRNRVASTAFAPGVLQAAGRRIVHAALSRITLGEIRLIDAAGPARSYGEASNGFPVVTVSVRDPSFYAAAAFGGGVGIAEAYMDGLWHTDDLAGLIETITLNLAAKESLEGSFARILAPLSGALYRLERNTRTGSRRNIVAHYDLGNDFFSLFLDPTMTYSCAIFDRGAATLEEAQLEKIDRACRKLDLRPSDLLLEIGTGWGALAVHAASRYGCRVTTTTISDEQHRLAKERIRREGLEDRVKVLKRDYRDLTGNFDKVVSIEMLEAVGAENLPRFFDAVSRLLRPDGAALIQSIVIRDQFFHRAARRRDFLKKYIFPGSCLPAVAPIMDAVSRLTDLRLAHLEDIGPHYVTTLRLWREAFMRRAADVARLGFDERFVRMWEYYLAYCEGAFRARHVGDVQMLFAKPLNRRRPSGEAA